MLTKHERVRRAISGETCDRPPFSFWCHLPPEAKLGEAAIQAHTQFYHQTNIDFIKMMIDGYRDISLGWSVQTPKDWDRLSLPRLDSEFIREQLTMIDGVVAAIHGEAPVIYHMFSPYSVMRMIWGHELIATHLHSPEARPHLLSALRAITAFQTAAAERYLTDSGAAGLMITVSGAEQDGPGEQVFQEIIRPTDMAVLDAVRRTGKYSMLHLCGWGVRPNRMAYWKDYPTDVMNYDVEADTTVPLCKAKEFFTAARAVMGGFGCTEACLLRSGAPEQIQAHARLCAAEGGSTSYFVGAGSSFPPGSVDLDRFRLVGETLEEDIK